MKQIASNKIEECSNIYPFPYSKLRNRLQQYGATLDVEKADRIIETQTYEINWDQFNQINQSGLIPGFNISESDLTNANESFQNSLIEAENAMLLQ